MTAGPGKRKILLIPGLCFIFLASGFSQGVLTGKVLKATDSIPLEGAHVRIPGTGSGTVTARDGSFILYDISKGTCTIRVSFIGFRDEERSVVIKDRQTTRITLFMVETGIQSSEIEITGKKAEKKVLEIPMRINVISSEKIMENPGQSIPQVLDYLSGVNLTNTMGIYSNSTVVTLRGLSGNDQGRTLVLLDDIPINKSDEGSVNWHLINRENVQQISVIKGPGSVIYGSNAMGGIISLKTRAPEKAVSGAASLSYGTFNTFNGRYFLSGKLKSKNSNRGFLYNMNGFYTRSDGYNAEIPEYLEKSDTFTVNTYVREADIGAKSGYQFNANSTVDVSVNYFNDKRGRGIQIYEVDGAYERHNSWQEAVHYSGGKGSLHWKMNAFNLTEYFERLNEYMSEAEYHLYMVESTRADRGGLISLSAGPYKNNLFTGGFELRMGSVNGQDTYYTSTDLISNSGNMENYGLFVQDEISLLGKKIEMNLGLRLDYAVFHDGMFNIEDPSYSIEYMTAYTDTLIPTHTWLRFDPKFSVQYRFTPLNRIFLTLGRGFRAPMLDDLCRTGKIRNGFKIANPALNPEYIDNIELGLDITLWTSLHIAPSVYYSIGYDFMYYVSTGDTVNMGYKLAPVFQKRNISIVDIAGAEIDLNFDPVPWLSIFANYTFACSKIRKFEGRDSIVDKDLDGKFLNYVPMNKASAGITWKNKIVNCNLLWKYVGSRWINDMNEPDPVLLISQYPPYNTLGIRVWHVFFRHLTVAVNVDNIFNVKYVDDKLQSSPGRLINAELTVQF
jgi:outer membrane receptor protein involved in Fe transport